MPKFHRDWKSKRQHGVKDHVPYPYWRIRFYPRDRVEDECVDHLHCLARQYAHFEYRGYYRFSLLYPFGPRSQCCVFGAVDMRCRGMTRPQVKNAMRHYFDGLLFDVRPMRLAKTWPNSAALKDRCDADVERQMLESHSRLCPRKPLPTQSPKEMYPAMMCKPECIDLL